MSEHELVDRTIEGHHEAASFLVVLTGPRPDGTPRNFLPPITFIVQRDPFRLHDWLTPDKARVLGQALIDAADAADEAQARMEESAAV